ncbi:MAG: hydrolase [Chitinivibrionales bacterium]|nr:hydrolase [Chitinivibrionales bacterium]
MSLPMPTAEEALSLLKEYTHSESLLKHAFAVEAAMRYFGRKAGENEEIWGIVGLIHDLDYEQFPQQHCKKTEEILTQRQWPPELIRAAISHGYGICTDVAPQSAMEKTLYAVDELCGFITACALVRPSKSVMDLTAKSVLKKWNQKGFAAGADRSLIEKGAALLNMQLEELITDVIMALRQKAALLGL